MTLNASPTPFKAAIAERGSLQMTRAFFNWILPSITRAQSASTTLFSVALTALTASIALTSALPTPASGRYRVSFLGSITTPASVSSSLIPTVTYTRNGIPCTESGAALTSNATNAPKSWTFLVKADASTPISYSSTYGSVGTAMAYALDVTIESVG